MSSTTLLKYDFSKVRILAKTGEAEYGYFAEDYYDYDKQKQLNYTKNVKWSPDGCCLLSNSEDNQLRLYEFPKQQQQTQESATIVSETTDTTTNAPATTTVTTSISSDNQELISAATTTGSSSSIFAPSTTTSSSSSSSITELRPVLRYQENSSVYDFCWYPFLNSSEPSTCCFLTTQHQRPIHMWDAFTGKLRASYSCLDPYYEVTHAYTCAFNQSANKIYAGMNKQIRIFDVEAPGNNSTVIKTAEAKDQNAQNSIISCFAFYPNSMTYAAGCYNKTIGIYDERNKFILQMLTGHSGGVTHMLFSANGYYLISGARKDDSIVCWDVRTWECLFTCERKMNTNQRMLFDIDPLWNRYLISGTTEPTGEVAVFDLLDGGKKTSSFTVPDAKVALNATVFHPFYPYIAISSGERINPSEESATVPSSAVFIAQTEHQMVENPSQQH